MKPGNRSDRSIRRMLIAIPAIAMSALIAGSSGKEATAAEYANSIGAHSGARPVLADFLFAMTGSNCFQKPISYLSIS